MPLSTGVCIAVGFILLFCVFTSVADESSILPVVSSEDINTEIRSSGVEKTSGLVETETVSSKVDDPEIANLEITKQETGKTETEALGMVTPKSKVPDVVIASPDVTASIIKVSGGLLLVIAAIFGSAWFFRRFGHFSPVSNDALRVIGGLTIGQKEKIVLIQVGEEQVLVGVAPGNIQTLHVLGKTIALNENERKNAFSQSLGEAVSKLRK